MTGRFWMRWGTGAVALVFLATAVAAYVVAQGFPASRTPGSPGPGGAPMLYAAALAALALAILIRSVAAMPVEEAGLPDRQGAFRTLAMIGFAVAFVLLLNVVPFWLLAALWFLPLALLLGAEWRAALIGAVVVAGAIYVGFIVLLGVPLG